MIPHPLGGVLVLFAVVLVIATVVIKISFNWQQLGNYAGGKYRKQRFPLMAASDCLLGLAWLLASLVCGLAPVLLGVRSVPAYWTLSALPALLALWAILYTLARQAHGSRTLLDRMGQDTYRTESTYTGPIRLREPLQKAPYNTNLDRDIIDPD